jgi:hypothetical protein
MPQIHGLKSLKIRESVAKKMKMTENVRQV